MVLLLLLLTLLVSCTPLNYHHVNAIEIRNNFVNCYLDIPASEVRAHEVRASIIAYKRIHQPIQSDCELDPVEIVVVPSLQSVQVSELVVVEYWPTEQGLHTSPKI